MTIHQTQAFEPNPSAAVQPAAGFDRLVEGTHRLARGDGHRGHDHVPKMTLGDDRDPLDSAANLPVPLDEASARVGIVAGHLPCIDQKTDSSLAGSPSELRIELNQSLVQRDERQMRRQMELQQARGVGGAAGNHTRNPRRA